jgi:hypothetical protein
MPSPGTDRPAIISTAARGRGGGFHVSRERIGGFDAFRIPMTSIQDNNSSCGCRRRPSVAPCGSRPRLLSRSSASQQTAQGGSQPVKQNAGDDADYENENKRHNRVGGAHGMALPDC